MPCDAPRASPPCPLNGRLHDVPKGTGGSWSRSLRRSAVPARSRRRRRRRQAASRRSWTRARRRRAHRTRRPRRRPARRARAAGATAAGQAAGTQLVPFQGKNGFTVLMPANPVQDDRVQEAPGGQVQVHIAQAQDPAGKYMTSLSEFPKGSLDRIKSKDLLDSLQQATIQSMGGTLVNAHDVEAGGLPGREFTATDPQGSEVTARVFVGESKVYTLAGTYPQGQQMPGSIQQFLGSFQPPPGTAVGGSGSAGAAASDGSAGSSGLNNTSDAWAVPPIPARPRCLPSRRRRARSTAAGARAVAAPARPSRRAVRAPARAGDARTSEPSGLAARLPWHGAMATDGAPVGDRDGPVLLRGRRKARAPRPGRNGRPASPRALRGCTARAPRRR